MKMHKQMNKYCPKCNSYQTHTVTLYKKGKDRLMAHGKRRYERKKKGYGSQPKPVQKRFSKNTKKITPKTKCGACGRITMMKAIRLKKIEIM